jgi:hypothetical protein
MNRAATAVRSWVLQFGRTLKGKVRRLIPESVMAAA